MTFAALPISLGVKFQVERKIETFYRILNIPFDFLCQNIDISFELLQFMTLAALHISLRVEFQGV